MVEPTYVAVLKGENRPLWSTEGDTRKDCYDVAIRQGLRDSEFDVVNTEDLDLDCD